ncbi:MAG: hypothetical protein WKF96_25685 [Solirubrobacteraceae bacterium]
MNENTDMNDVRIEFRVAPEVAARIDACAHYAGESRSGWLRLACGFTGTTQTLAELDRLEGASDLSTAQQRIRAEAVETLGQIERALRPKPLIAVNAN